MLPALCLHSDHTAPEAIHRSLCIEQTNATWYAGTLPSRLIVRQSSIQRLATSALWLSAMAGGMLDAGICWRSYGGGNLVNIEPTPSRFTPPFALRIARSPLQWRRDDRSQRFARQWILTAHAINIMYSDSVFPSIDGQRHCSYISLQPA